MDIYAKVSHSIQPALLFDFEPSYIFLYYSQKKAWHPNEKLVSNNIISIFNSNFQVNYKLIIILYLFYAGIIRICSYNEAIGNGCM